MADRCYSCLGLSASDIPHPPSAIRPPVMLNVLTRWAIPLSALFLLGPIGTILIVRLAAPDGGHQVSLLLSTSPIQGVLGGVLALGVALLAGVLGARFIEQRSGLMAAGLVLAWSAWNMGRVDRILARTRTPSTLYTLAAEAALFGLLAVVVAIIILKVPTRMPRFIAAGDTTRTLGDKTHHEPVALFDKTAPIALIAAIAGAAVGAWFVAAEPTKGQTFAAAAIAGLLAAAAGRLASQRVSPAWFFLGLTVVAIAGPIIATFMHAGTLGPTRAALDGRLFPLARLMPLDWMAGGFVGVPLGLWWAGSLIEKHEHH